MRFRYVPDDAELAEAMRAMRLRRRRTALARAGRRARSASPTRPPPVQRPRSPSPYRKVLVVPDGPSYVYHLVRRVAAYEAPEHAVFLDGPELVDAAGDAPLGATAAFQHELRARAALAVTAGA